MTKMTKTVTRLDALRGKGPNGAKLAAAMATMGKAGWTLRQVKRAVAVQR